MKIIIFGCGKVGSTIISSLSSEKHDIVAIDKNQESVEEIANTYDIIGLCGNGVDSDTMIEAGVQEAELFIAVTGSDELNMLGCFLARKMGAKHTIARIRNPEYNDESLGIMKQYLDLSVSLNPERSIAHEIFNVLRFPSAVKVETFSGGNLEIVDIIIKSDSPFAGKTLADLRKEHSEHFLVCNVMRENQVYIPDGLFELKVGDKIGLIAAHNDILKILKSVGMPQKQPKSVMILGASRISFYLAKMLMASGVDVKIIERDRQRCMEFSNVLPGVVMIAGDGMQREVLLEEGISSVDAFISLTGTDEENILSAFSAIWQHVPTVIAKVNRTELAQTAEMLGLECIISPGKTVGNIITRYARALHNSLGSNVETLYKLMDGKTELLEFKVAKDFEYVKIPLRNMTLKNNIIIAGIVRGRKPIIPSGDDIILAGDRVIVMASGQELYDLSDIIQ